MNATYSELTTSINDKDFEIAGLKKDLSNTNSQYLKIEEMNTNLKNVKSEKEKLVQQISENKAKIASLEEIVKSKSLEIETL